MLSKYLLNKLNNTKCIIEKNLISLFILFFLLFFIFASMFFYEDITVNKKIKKLNYKLEKLHYV